MSDAELEKLARAAADRAVRELLVTLGVDMTSAEKIIQVQVDLAYLRRQRRASERIASGFRAAVILTAVSGAAGILWLGLKMALTGK